MAMLLPPVVVVDHPNGVEVRLLDPRTGGKLASVVLRLAEVERLTLNCS